MTDTIAAIATPYGSGGIGVIRISGPEAFRIAGDIFSRGASSGTQRVPTVIPETADHRVLHGFILEGPDVVDEVLLIPMKGPGSYTAEDVVEIQAHSGPIVLRRILDLILERGGRAAEPGEFTKRAFLNGRIDLTQAEAVADIINARSNSYLKFAASQNTGALKKEILSMRDTLTQLLSRLEAAIDFPDDVEGFTLSDEDMSGLTRVLDNCRMLIQQHEDACFLKTGIRVAIAGEPNVGKSSLMNRILGKEKSIITSVPGTTRDPIEEGMNINGIPFVMVDTAGIHQTDDLVEIIGIEKARDHITAADVIIYMTEPGKPFQQPAFSKVVPNFEKKIIFVINKMDLAHGKEVPELPEELNHIPVIHISALKNQGIDALKNKLTDICIRNLDLAEDAVVPNLRHKNALGQALAYLEAVKSGLTRGQEEETLALDLRNSIDVLGTITGETASIDILDAIFNNFCIGK